MCVVSAAHFCISLLGHFHLYNLVALFVALSVILLRSFSDLARSAFGLLLAAYNFLLLLACSLYLCSLNVFVWRILQNFAQFWGFYKTFNLRFLLF